MLNTNVEKVVNKIDKLKRYLSDGLERYQDVLEKQQREIPVAPEGVEYRDPRNYGKSNFYCFK